MHPAASLLTVLLLYPLGVLSQATPQQTIVPFTTLPACAASCGPLYDAQGACSPPVVPSTSLPCFCSYQKLQPFYTSTTNVCDNACTGDPTGLGKIQQWFVGLCAQVSAPTATAANSAATAAGTPAPGSSANPQSTTTGSQNSTWISTHWQWVIMIVVLTLAIVIGWIGACLLRRRYIHRKEREYELRPPAAPWVSGGPRSAGPYQNGDATAFKGKDKEATAGMFVAQPASVARMTEKTQKKWVVKERT